MNTGIDALVDTITSMDIGQITDYNKIVVEPGMQEVHIEQYQYEAHVAGERTCGYCSSFREAWKEVLNSMQEITDRH